MYKNKKDVLGGLISMAGAALLMMVPNFQEDNDNNVDAATIEEEIVKVPNENSEKEVSKSDKTKEEQDSKKSKKVKNNKSDENEDNKGNDDNKEKEINDKKDENTTNNDSKDKDNSKKGQTELDSSTANSINTSSKNNNKTTNSSANNSSSSNSKSNNNNNKANEAAKRKAKQEAERKAKEEAERKAKEEAAQNEANKLKANQLLQNGKSVGTRRRGSAFNFNGSLSGLEYVTSGGNKKKVSLSAAILAYENGMGVDGYDNSNLLNGYAGPVIVKDIGGGMIEIYRMFLN